MDSLPNEVLLRIGKYIPIADWLRFISTCSELWRPMKDKVPLLMPNAYVESHHVLLSIRHKEWEKLCQGPPILASTVKRSSKRKSSSKVKEAEIEMVDQPFVPPPRLTEWEEWLLVSSPVLRMDLARNRRYEFGLHPLGATLPVLSFLLENQLFFDLVLEASKFLENGLVLQCASDHSALKAAVLTNNLDVVGLLLPFEDPSFDDNYCLRTASKDGHAKLFALLLSDSRTDPSVDHHSILFQACSDGHTEIVKLLLKHPNIDPAFEGQSALHLAIRNNHLAIVRLLIRHPSINPALDDQYCFKLAFDQSHDTIYYYLLSDSRIDPSVDNWYTFLESCKYGDLHYLELVMEKLGDVHLKTLAWKGWLKAIECGQTRIQKFLYDYIPKSASESHLAYLKDPSSSGVKKKAKKVVASSSMPPPTSGNRKKKLTLAQIEAANQKDFVLFEDFGEVFSDSSEDTFVTNGTGSRAAKDAPLMEKVVCMLCPENTPLLPKNLLRAHLAGHAVSEDFSVVRCGFCGNSESPCRTTIVPGKFKGSAKHKPSVVPNSECPMYYKFHYGSTIKRGGRTCTNVPVQCPVADCKEGWIWSYCLFAHLHNTHKGWDAADSGVVLAPEIADLCTIDETEKAAMLENLKQKRTRRGRQSMGSVSGSGAADMDE
jgi:hypothetical protein